MKTLLLLAILALCSCGPMTGYRIIGGVQTDQGTVTIDDDGNIRIVVDATSGK